MIRAIVSLEEIHQDYSGGIFCDVRYSLDGTDGYQEYLTGHIPDARFVSMDRDLAAKPGAGVGRHPLPSPEDFASALGRLGIAADTTVIAYDAVGGRFASRMVWMLRVIGQSAAVLDGGLQAWIDQPNNGTLQLAVPKWPTVNRQSVPWPSSEIATADEVADALSQGKLVVDARAPERYRGEVEPLDPQAGHIPGAVNLFLGGNYQTNSNYFKRRDQLEDRYRQAGFDSETICYCGSGVTACNNVLAAEAAGFPRPRLFVGPAPAADHRYPRAARRLGRPVGRAHRRPGRRPRRARARRVEAACAQHGHRRLQEDPGRAGRRLHQGRVHPGGRDVLR